MNIKTIIEKKINREALTNEEVKFFVENYTKDLIPDYQASSLITAITIVGLNVEEIKAFTYAMRESGDILNFSDIAEEIVDKHSTGGVGDKITIILMPILAALGYKVAKMSGRGLGYTGGTADKLETIKGYNIVQSLENIKNNVRNIGISLTTQTEDLAPADKKIYALRDSIGCTNSLGLIASSIMSKKLASGTNNIVLDITCGSGAFMKNIEDAKKLANIMESLADDKIKVSSVITSMDQPLGYSVGNLLEVIESLEILKGRNVEDVLEVVYALGSKIMSKDYSRKEAKEKIEEVIKNGLAYEKFLELVKAQGGDVEYLINNDFEKAQHIIQYNINDGKINADLWVKEINALEVAKASFVLGAGRKTKEDNIDPLVGIVLNVKVGDKLEESLLATIHTNDLEKVEEAKKHLSQAFVFSTKKQEKINPIIQY